MRFPVAAAALISLASSVVATTTTFIKPEGDRKWECRRWSRVSWKKFSVDTQVAILILKDAKGATLGQQQVEPSLGWVDMYIPEYYDQVAKFILVDVSTNVVFAEGEEFSVDCPKRDGAERSE